MDWMRNGQVQMFWVIGMELFEPINAQEFEGLFKNVGEKAPPLVLEHDNVMREFYKTFHMLKLFRC